MTSRGEPHSTQQPDDSRPGSVPRPRAFVLVAGDPSNDPRIGWVAATLSARFEVIEIGLFRDFARRRMPTLESIGYGRRRARVPTSDWPAFIPEGPGAAYAENPGWATLAGFSYEVADDDFAVSNRKRIKLDVATHSRRFQMRHIVRTNVSLIRAARALGPAEVIVAADLDTLAAGVVLKSEFGARLIYDAHEFWPYQFPSFRSAVEEEPWLRIERRLVREADARFVVSPQLAVAMSEAYGAPFGALPNAMPLSDAPNAPARRVATSDRTEFLFLGGFAAGRGILPLIEAWRLTPAACVLVLQGPENAYRSAMIAEAQRTGLLGSRILFPAAIPEADLISRAAQADVGLIPYEPTLINHVFCSPNKLSQYMAAGLPILANTTQFVRQTIEAADCGVVADFKTPEAIAEAVGRLAGDIELRERLGRNGRRGFEIFFHWEAFAPALMASVEGVDLSPTPSQSEPETSLKRAFQSQAPVDINADQSLVGRVARSGVRLMLRGIWHGVPFLRVIVLSSPRFRRRAENLREL